MTKSNSLSDDESNTINNSKRESKSIKNKSRYNDEKRQAKLSLPLPKLIKTKKVLKDSSEGIAAELGLKVGSTIVDKNNEYVVNKIVGEGGFGAVFQVFKQKAPNKYYAMKVEKRGRKHSKLKMEIAILKEIKRERDLGNLQKHKSGPHFTELLGRGKLEAYVYIVMELVGKSLCDLKNLQPHNVFSIGSAIFAAIQCLEAIQDLHRLYFIHRDIKPANYAIGLHKKKRAIYMLDFGIARKIVNQKNELKTPRGFVGFKGTVRFASRNCHHNRELSFSDDCESWFYLLVDMSVSSGLPWRRIEDKNNVLKKKEECILSKEYWNIENLPCASHFLQVIDYIAGLEYQNSVDYTFLYALLTEAARVSNVDLNTIHLDWE